MKQILILLCLLHLFVSSNSFAQASEPFDPVEHESLRGVQLFDRDSGIAFSNHRIFQTRDGGISWDTIPLGLGLFDRIADADLSKPANWMVLVANRALNSMAIFRSSDGGANWKRTIIEITDADLNEADLSESKLIDGEFPNGTLAFKIPLVSSSNFIRTAIIQGSEDGNDWNILSKTSETKRSEETVSSLGTVFSERSLSSEYSLEGILQEANADDGSKWILTVKGECYDGKTNCEQIVRLRKVETEANAVIKITDITPENIQSSKENTSRGSFLPPNGTTRISLNRGFDKCTAAPVDQMLTWWNNSPFYDVNIYHSGRNRGCSQAQLSAAWVNAVTAQGWGLIPTVVGYQSPCSVCTNCAKHSSDPATAETQGRGEADIAITDANNLGLTQGTVLYYDMERYDDLSGTGACSTPTKAFLKGWTDRVKELGYISGVYGSPTNAQNDWINIPIASRMDVVWLARWNNVMSVWGVAPLSDAYWTNHQRIHQWLGPRNETWGGVTFNIDNNISDAPVAGLAVRRNANADFDGDGKTDISVFRPETGVWYVLNSANSSFGYTAFGTSSDVLAPGDYDGDGKTDHAVFRPSEGVWYLLTKAGMFSSTQFGASGDLPVPADFNDDGKADLAVFRPSTGVWYIANSDSLRTFTIVQFGTSGDKPVQADFDGDGRADIAVYRPSTGVWYVLRSSDGNFSASQFGIASDIPVQSDLDGDGRADFGIFRNGVWYVLQSGGETTIVSFGQSGDVPVAGDFDGDGKSDRAVFRPSNGVWYLLRSRDGFAAAAFGTATDRPVPRAYFPQ